MSRFPDWAIKFKRKGTILKMIKDECYLYTVKSFRVKGKKNPQTTQTYLGKVTEEGVVVGVDVNIDKPYIPVYEYGFSKAVETLVMKDIESSKDAEEDKAKLLCLIRRFSPWSYLVESQTRFEPEVKQNAVSLFQVKIEGLLGFELEKLRPLMGIYLIEVEQHKVISRINDEQQALLDEIGVKL